MFVLPLTTVEQHAASLGRVLLFKSTSLSTKKLGVVHKNNPQRVAVAVFVCLFLMSSDPCSRRNSELCLFGFNHCEVSAQLCKTCVTNLSKEHTEEQQEAKVWWETMNSDPDSRFLCTNATNTHPPNVTDPLLVLNHQSPLKGANSQQQPKLSLKQRCKKWPVLTARWCGFSRRQSHYVAVCVCEWVGGSLHSSNNTDQDQVSQLSVPTGDCPLCTTETVRRRRASPPLLSLMVIKSPSSPYNPQPLATVL